MISLDPKLKKIKDKIIDNFTDIGHTFNHTERVFNMAVRITESEEDINIEVVKLAVLLHDVARNKKGDHAVEGAKMARDILSEESYSKEIIDHVCDCIETHRYSKGLEPKSKEGAVLQDADRLDALGAMIIARVLRKKSDVPLYDPDIPPAKVYPSEEAGKTRINHLKEKCLKITPESFHFKTAKNIAKERYEFVKEFIERFEKEWKGEL